MSELSYNKSSHVWPYGCDAGNTLKITHLLVKHSCTLSNNGFL